MKDYCMSCVYFVPINEDVGYCGMLGVGILKGVAILDAFSTLVNMGISENSDIYSRLIVQSRFCCVCYKRIAVQ
jgi:hypothetical protein